MEILKTLTESEISALRDVFDGQEEGLDVKEFEAVLTDACKHNESINPAQLRLRELFSEIDTSGDGYVNWDEFTMFIINRTDGKHKVASGTGLDGVIKNYLLSHVVSDEIPKTIVDMRYLNRLDKIVKTIRQDRGTTRVRVCNNDFKLSSYFDIPRQGPDSAVIACEYIPEGRTHIDNCLAISYTDSFLRCFDMQKKRLTMHNETRMVKSVRLAESQTVLRWSSRYDRLVMGSRTGIVSVLHPDEEHVYNQEKLHALLVADMVVDDNLLFTASVDPEGSVKCVDLQRNVVRYALNDHLQGATMIAVNPAFQTLFSVGFELHIVSHAMLMPRVKAWKLTDSARPHRGRITQLHLVPNTPQLFSSDSCGLTKMWDIRMNGCVQNIVPPKDELEITPPEQASASSMCIVAPSKRIIINGRNTAIYCYEGAVDPSVADEVPAHLVLLNASTQTLMTVHQRTLKYWDLMTGELTATHKDLLKEDITCGFVMQPLERKMFLGTSNGGVFKLSCSLGDVEKDLSSYFVGLPCRGQDVLALAHVPTLRESSVPYVLAAFRRHVVLLPDVEGHSTKGPIELTSLTHALPPHVLVKCLNICRGTFLLIGCSDATVRVIDLNTLGLLSSWSHPGLLFGEVITLAVQPLAGTNNGCVAFAAVGGGAVACGVSTSAGPWDTAECWGGTDHCEVKISALPPMLVLHDTPQDAPMPLPIHGGGSAQETRVGGGGLSVPRTNSRGRPTSGSATPQPFDALRSPSSRCPSSGDPTPEPRHLPSHQATANPHNRKSIAKHRASAAGSHAATALHQVDSAVTAYLDATTQVQRDRFLGSCVVVVQVLPSHDLLATADERGTVTLWDVSPCLKHCGMFVVEPFAAPSASFPPTMIRWWSAHKDEITSMLLFCDKDTNHVCLVTASNDKSILLWSADGVLLGNLALGREDGATLVRGVEPYLFKQKDSSHWASFNAMLAEREVQPIFPSMGPVGSMASKAAAAAADAKRSSASASYVRSRTSGTSASSMGGGSGTSTPLPPISSVSPQENGETHQPTAQPLAAEGSGGGLAVPHRPVSRSSSFFMTTVPQDTILHDGPSATPSAPGSGILDPHLTATVSQLSAAMLQQGRTRFGNLIKPMAQLGASLKRDVVPRHLSHTGVLPDSARLRSPRRVPLPPPAAAAAVGGTRSPPRASTARGPATSTEQRLPSASPPPGSPRKHLSTDPPPPMRQHMNLESKRVLQFCKERAEPKSPGEVLRRAGRIILGSPDPQHATHSGTAQEGYDVCGSFDTADGHGHQPTSPLRSFNTTSPRLPRGGGAFQPSSRATTASAASPGTPEAPSYRSLHPVRW